MRASLSGCYGCLSSLGLATMVRLFRFLTGYAGLNVLSRRIRISVRAWSVANLSLVQLCALWDGGRAFGVNFRSFRIRFRRFPYVECMSSVRAGLTVNFQFMVM